MRIWSSSALVVTGALFSACTSDTDVAGVGRDTFVPDVQRTTSEVVARANLDASIDRADRMRDVEAGTLARLARARFYGTFGDFDWVDAASREATGDTRIVRARVLARQHNFADALALLDTIETKSERKVELRATALAAVGRADEALAYLADEGYPRDQKHHYDTWAIAKAAAGDFDGADADYRSGLARYRDVSPYPVAATLFAMGVMWSERAGDAERGRQLYAAAVERLPGFVTANVHLAELEVAADPPAAIERLEALLDGTLDPEPHSRIAQWRAMVGLDAEAHRRAAREGYESLLAKYPLAFADHAAEFYLGAGDDPARALELATMNLDERKNARAYGLAIRAAQAAGQPACDLLEEARTRYPNAVELEGLTCESP